METWPPELRNTTKARAKDRTDYGQQVSGAAIDLPTSQLSQRKPSTPAKNIRKHDPCDICGKLIQPNMVAKDKHTRTHLPGYKKGGKGRKKKPGDEGQQGAVAVPGSQWA